MTRATRGAGARPGRMAGVLAALAAGALAFAPPAAALPGPAGTAPAGYAFTLAADRLPPGARPATGAPPAPGSYGPAFQPLPTTAPSGPPSAQIVNGTPVASADHPSVVGILSYFPWDDPDNGLGPRQYVSTCTGTVVSPTKVLTAAHCVVGRRFGTIRVVAGRSDLAASTGGFVAEVTAVWTHQNFNLAALRDGRTRVPVDDVSVLTLRQPLQSAYPPVVLNPQGDQSRYAPGTSGTIVGYGVTATGARDSGRLHAASVPVQSDGTCAAQFGSDYNNMRVFCAGAAPTDTCNGDSGGPLMVGGVQIGITDWGPAACGSSYGVYERLSYYHDAVAADLTRAPVQNLDWTGDGHSDLFTSSTAGVTVHSGSGLASDGAGGFNGSRFLTLNTEFGYYRKLFRVGNWNGDGKPSIMGMLPDGRLFQHRQAASDWNGLDERTQVGSGWNMFNDIMVVTNWTGDGRPNLLGRTPGGELFLYTSDGAGGWLNGGRGIKIGWGWHMFDTVLTPGPWTGDDQTLIGRTPGGALLMYKSDGAGGWRNGGVGVTIGTGWNMFTRFMSPGDWSGDNAPDLIGITPAGAMRLYRSDGAGGWLNGLGEQIATGWDTSSGHFF